MAEFTADVYQNEFLPDGGTDVNAIVTMRAPARAPAGQSGGGGAGEIIIVDTSGSMGAGHDGRRQGGRAGGARPDRRRHLVRGDRGRRPARARLPAATGAGDGADGRRTRREASARSTLRADGGTAIGTWLTWRAMFASVPQVTQRHAILLTDGENQRRAAGEARRRDQRRPAGSSATAAASAPTGRSRSCADRHGAARQRRHDPGAGPDAGRRFRAMMRRRWPGVADAQLRVWAPQGAQVLFVRQVSPTVEDLTARRTTVNALTGAYPTGAWGDESRDYHVAIRVPSKPVGREQLAARVQIAVGGDVLAPGLVKASWSDDTR